jgi:hypothetical protein
MKVLGFDDLQMRLLVESARPLYDRSAFLRDVVEALPRGVAAVGNAELRAVIARVQRERRAAD